MFNARDQIYPPTPRKVRLLRDISLIIAALQICYVLGMRTWLQSFPTPPAIVLALRAIGCQDSALAGFCTAAAQQTAIGVIVPSVRILCLWGSFFIVPLGPLFLLTRSR